MMETAGRGESLTVLEGEQRHKDGHTVFLEVSGKPIFDEQGAAVGYMGIAHDITERKVSEEKLLQAMLELNAIFSALPDSIIRIGKDGTVISYNGAGFDRIHMNPAALLNKNICDALPEDIGHKFKEAIRQVNSTAGMVTIEYTRIIGDRMGLSEARFQPVPGDQIVIIISPIVNKKPVEKP